MSDLESLGGVIRQHFILYYLYKLKINKLLKCFLLNGNLRVDPYFIVIFSN